MSFSATSIGMPMPTPPPPPAAGGQRRQENLALIFQEMLTAIVRLRYDLPEGRVRDAEAFRNMMKSAVASIRQEALRKNYPSDFVEKSCFACVAFLDEAAQGSSNLVLADWHSRLLANDLYRDLTGGDVFFEHLENLEAQRDSQELADVLEVFVLCLLLGFRGRYAFREEEARSLIKRLEDRITSIRGPLSLLSPAGMLPQDVAPPAPKNYSVGPWLWVAAATLVLTILLFTGFKLTLNFGLRTIDHFASDSKS
jgi:type VI secretion system protein ImpK